MAQLEMTFKLPSLGKPYVGHPELAGDITIKMISGLQEKRMFGSSSNLSAVLDDVMKECIVSPAGVDIDLLTPSDKHFILTKMRIHTYGADYHLSGKCPYCGREHEYKVSLDEVEIKELTEEFTPTYKIKLPVSEHEVELKVLTSGDYKKIRKRVDKMVKDTNVVYGEQEYITRLAATIQSIDGEQVVGTQKEKFIQDLNGRDIAFIKHCTNKYTYGYSDYITVPCVSCGEDIKLPVMMTSEFFRPRFD